MKPSSQQHVNFETRRRWPALCCAFLVVSVLLLPLRGIAREEPTDPEINAAVEGDLAYDRSVPFNDIDVSTTNGIVTLSGEAENLLAKERATMIAETIRGVRSVVNNITVDPVDRTDNEIRNDIKAALLADPASDAYEIATTVNDGVVTLSGNVDSWREKRLAEDVAKGVKGVTDVVNGIKITYRSDRPDNEIAEEVRNSLSRDVWVDDVFIRTTVHDGVVSLAGTVGSAAEKTRARSDAWVNGVKSVDVSKLNVEPWARDEMRKPHSASMVSDAQIKRAVIDAFLFDPRVNSFNPEVTVNSGAVTLTGTVDNLKAKRAAEQDARNTTGVWRVKNYLKVRNQSPPTDEMLEDNVTAALARDPYVDRYQIDVSSMNGVVHLNGTVDSYYEKLHADDVASRVNGVTSVNNNLEVMQPTFGHYYWPYSWSFYEPNGIFPRDYASRTLKSDTQVKEDIEDELFWSPFVDSDQINVSVNNGVATLTGTVDNWTEYSYVTENALEGGAIRVINNLTVI